MDFHAPSEQTITLINQVWRARPCSDQGRLRRLWTGVFSRAPGEWRRKARPRIGRGHTVFTPTCRACWATPKRAEEAYVAASTDPNRVEV